MTFGYQSTSKPRSPHHEPLLNPYGVLTLPFVIDLEQPFLDVALAIELPRVADLVWITVDHADKLRNREVL